MAKKYYVVWRGRKTGVFEDWETCKRQVHGFAGARFKSFPTRGVAEAAFRGEGDDQPQPTPAAATPGQTDLPSGAPLQKKRKVSTVKTYDASEVAAIAADTKIFSDGGCEPNPGKAGSGVAVYRGGTVSELWYGLYNPNGTNNTAELSALHYALAIARDETNAGRVAVVFSDSKYSIQCVTVWAAGWSASGWRRKGGELKNLELIKRTFELYESVRGDVEVLHVNGHVGLEGNELADRMSILAIETQADEFCRYREEIDIPAILATRPG